jgi:prepilin peptidase CpaA
MFEMWSALEIIIASIAAGLFLLAAWQDFQNWKIRNWTIVALLACYLLFVLVRWTASGSAGSGMFPGEFVAGALLFVLGFTLWAFGFFGAGDAKLLLPVGLFLGFSHLLPFAFALMIFGVVFLLALKYPIPANYLVTPALVRFDEIRRTGKVPYGVVITAAALFAMYVRFRGAG